MHVFSFPSEKASIRKSSSTRAVITLLHSNHRGEFAGFIQWKVNTGEDVAVSFVFVCYVRVPGVTECCTTG